LSFHGLAFVPSPRAFAAGLAEVAFAVVFFAAVALVRLFAFVAFFAFVVGIHVPLIRVVAKIR
jgi:hypothetical protein